MRIPQAFLLAALALTALATQAPAFYLYVAESPQDAAGVHAQRREYAVRDGNGTVLGTQAWRVFNGTGNCCESHLAVTPSGRLLDAGAEGVFYTDDGIAWKSVVPYDVILGDGEGAVAVAPNGDVLAVTWQMGGDRLISIRYDAAADRWTSAVLALHTPFYDRPWLAIIPGPVPTANGPPAPHAAVLTGGSPTRTMLVSVDGLTYWPWVYYSNATAADSRPFARVADATSVADHVQPVSHAQVTPLPQGGAVLTLGETGLSTGCPGWVHVHPDFEVTCLPADATPTPQRRGALRIDATGRLHRITPTYVDTDQPRTHLVHHVSLDGGATWSNTTLRFPPGWTLPHAHAARGVDFVASGVLDTVALASHLRDDEGRSRVLVHRITDLDGEPQVRMYELGVGGISLGTDMGATGPRLDFLSVVLLPDGRIAASFADAEYRTPAVAVEAP